MRDHSVWCWGANDSGQLGIAGVNVTTMTPVHAFDGATAIAAGEFHTCAIRDGDVYCWGDNDRGQVAGDGLHIGGQRVMAPMLLPGLHDVVALALGESVSCARRSDGTAACWGDNEYAELAQGDLAPHLGIQAVPLTAPATEIAAHWGHICAAVADHVECWGANDHGEVDGTPSAPVSTPAIVPGVGRAYAIAAGGEHTCAITGAGVVCWGSNDMGQLGSSSSSTVHTALACDAAGGAAPSTRYAVRR
jgi:alpha-tubulin suppressor-like RCC1 family protein